MFSSNLEQHRFSLPALLSIIAAATLATACSSADDSVTPKLEIINHTSSALSADAITAVNGTYGDACDGRASDGSDTWTFAIGNPAGTTLSVRKNDADCVLTIKSLVAGGTFIATPDIPLTAAWKATASAFAESSQPIAFYGNAMISSTTFASDPTISVLVSDSPNASTPSEKSADFVTYSSNVSTETVPASSYALDLDSFDVAKDANSVVQSVAGYAQLTQGAVAGQDYAIYDGALTGSSTIEEIEAAFASAQAKGALASLTSLQLPASDFALAGVDLGTRPQRTIIIRNTDRAVSSYQLLLITFKP